MQLDIPADVVEALEKVSAKTNRSPGAILSDLVRGPLALIASIPEEDSPTERPERTWILQDGFPLFPPTGAVVTSELVRKLRDGRLF